MSNCLAEQLGTQSPSLNEIRAEIARRSLIAFTTYTFPQYEVNWHHQLVGKYLDKFVKREIKRLMIFEPPRHGKSEQVSRRLPAYILGKFPDASIIACTYAAELSVRMNRDVQRIIDDPAYVEIFPETTLWGSNVVSVAHGTWLRNSEIFEIVGRKGVYKNAGVGGAITGMGFDYGIIDDPVKNREEASSPTYRQKVYDWYTSTFYTRAEKDACILLTTTRWHEDDLAGRLLELAKSDPSADQWVVLNLPAIAEGALHHEDIRQPREPLWPAKYSGQTLKVIKSTVGSYDWSALYQQNPTPSEGGILKRWRWKFWQPVGVSLPPVTLKGENGLPIEVAPATLPGEHLIHESAQSWDMAFKDTKSSSYVCGQVWARRGADKYLLDQDREKRDFVDTCSALKNLSNKWPKTRAKWVEDKANGPAVISSLKNTVPGLIGVNPQGSKEARAYAVSPDIEAGNVYLPHPALAPWVWDFIEECAGFPNSAYSDQVDTMSQALFRMRDKQGGKVFSSKPAGF